MPKPETDSMQGNYPSGTSLAVSKDFALFPHIHRTQGENLFLHERKIMEVMSYEIEDNVLNLKEASKFYCGFQRLSNFLRHETRYRKIVSKGHEILIFGVADVDPPAIEGIQYILLSEQHALAKEWFLVINAKAYFSALVAEELTEIPLYKRNKKNNPQPFHGVWTFDTQIVRDLESILSNELDLGKVFQKNPSIKDYQKQLSAIALSANHLVSKLENRNNELIWQQNRYEDLVNMMVHDLRNPLTSVIGSLELLAGGRVEEKSEIDQLIANSLENSLRLSRMISNVLDIKKMEEGHLTIKRELINLQDLLYQISSRWNISARAQNIILETDISNNLPIIVGDRELLERVLENLLNNAVKYATQILLTASFNGRNVWINVEDDGPGIPLADRSSIFDKFTQANLGQEQRKGTGLGLTFSKMAILAHGGEIQITDAGLGGAAFKIRLPLTPPRE